MATTQFLKRHRRLDRTQISGQIPLMGQSPDPLHGITLEKLLTVLVGHYGWQGLAEYVNVRCFKFDPSIKSSLQFLRRTPWARTKVEQLYVRLVSSS